MRVNKFVALATGLSRRAADKAIDQGRVLINGQPVDLGQEVQDDDRVTLDSQPITTAVKRLTLILNKPVGYVVSRNGQGSPTIYDLLPVEYHNLKPVGRLDKDSSGLLLLTNDGQLANELTHPRYAKTKIYEATLNKSLAGADQAKIEQGLQIDDYTSRLKLHQLGDNAHLQVTMSMGKNRQIRRTFAALDYKVIRLHRTHFGDYTITDLAPGKFQIV